MWTFVLESEVSFFVNGKDLVPSDIGLTDYERPLDVVDLQNLIQEFDITNICQGIMKPNLSHIRLNVFQSTDRWWHPKCKIIPVNDTGYELWNITYSQLLLILYK